MSNKIIQRILDKTNGGLDIILSMYPEASKCIDNNRHFKLRPNEKTASCSIKKMSNGNYYVKDHGSDFGGGAINLFMYREGVDLKTAIKALGTQYGCLDGPAQELYKPERSNRPASETEPEGHYEIKIKDDITQTELETIFSEHVINYAFNIHKDKWQEHLKKVLAAYGVYALVSFSYVKDRKFNTTASTENYPIFMIDGVDFKKIYQPKSSDKRFRFRYFGKKEKDYIFGYKRLIANFTQGEQKWMNDQTSIEDYGGEKPKKKKGKDASFQLEEVILCSGDRDSLNVAAADYNVIWLNSESSKIPHKIYNELKKMCRGVYMLPDIDSTGLKHAHELALEHLDLKVIELPAELKEHRDWRGNSCKDVTDYFKYNKVHGFKDLVKSALHYRFWDEEAFYDKEGEFKKNVYVFNNVCAYNFLKKSGFHRLELKAARDGYEYIHIQNNVVKIVNAKKVKAYVNNFLRQRYASNLPLRNAFYRSPQLKDESLDNLDLVKLDFNYYNKDLQYLFFSNETWKVNSQAIEAFKPTDIDQLVWEEKVIQHKVKLLEPAFEIFKKENVNQTWEWDIKINNQNCLFFNYLINTSRIHWRPELEERIAEMDDKEKTEYKEKNKFNIGGEKLTADEKEEQKLHLINKIYALGYLLHRYKDPAKAWAVFCMDQKIGHNDECNGGSGKSIFGKSVFQFLQGLELDGKNKHMNDDKHAFENVTEQTEYILVDDLSRYTSLEVFFAKITGDLPVNPKYTQRFVIPFETSPKFCFTTNFSVRDLDASTERRLLYASFSDYYHYNLNDEYKEERKVADDFGKSLFKDFTEEEWNFFFNTGAHCLKYYLMMDNKVIPPMDSVSKRNLQGIMGPNFQPWADVYFSEESDRLDEMVQRHEALTDFLKFSNNKHYTANKFTQAMEAWCRYYGYVFNPKQLQNTSKRIVRKDFKKDDKGQPALAKTAIEMFFIQTKPTIDPKHFKKSDAEQGTLINDKDDEDPFA